MKKTLMVVVMMRKTGVGIEFLVFVSTTMSSEQT